MNPLQFLTQLAIVSAMSPLLVLTAHSSPGDPDWSFGSFGQMVVPVGGQQDSAQDSATCLAIQSNGKILLGGYARGATQDFGFLRLETNGQLDVSFGVNGKMTTDFSTTNDGCYDVKIQADGKFIAVGYSANDFAIARYNQDGSLDTSFGSAGRVVVDFAGNTDFGTCCALQADGRVLAGGYSSSGSGNWYFSLVRLDASGMLDMTFSGDGKLQTILNGHPFDLTVQGDGKIILGGYILETGYWSSISVVRYNPNGSLDMSFGTSGISTIASLSGPNESRGGIELQSDGKIILGTTSHNDFLAFRLNSNGTIDNNFGANGRATIDFGTALSGCTCLKRLTDGKIMLGGFHGNDLAFARLNINGSLDPSFGVLGKSLADLGSSYDQAYCIDVQTDGKILLAGKSDLNGTEDFAVARFLGDQAAPEIGVEHNSGVQLQTGIGEISLGAAILGMPIVKEFTLRNTGTADLTGLYGTIQGDPTAGFSVVTSPSSTIPPGGQASIVVQFLPTATGELTAILQISSNDADENPFNVKLKGTALQSMADADGDGMSNLDEFSLKSWGFDPQINSTTLILALKQGGFFRISDIEDAALGSVLLEKNSLTGKFNMTLNPIKSSDLLNWSPLLGATITSNPNTGTINLEFPPSSASTEFYRVHAKKPAP